MEQMAVSAEFLRPDILARVPPGTPPRVAVGMSGGVDSSTVAALLRDAGCEVFGLTAKTWPSGSRCCSDTDIRRAQRTAALLGIAHYVIDLAEAFESGVVQPFADEYARGRTPSPCAVCNRRIKFGVLLEKARRLGAVCMATGHYARIMARDDGGFRLLRGVDPGKDQSYFLFDLSQTQLRDACFPLGGRHKPAVRELARRHGISEAERAESQDLCFAAPGEHWRVTERYRPDAHRPGRVVDSDGTELGRHEGIHRFTVGQRRGLGIADGRRLYVKRLQSDSNEVVLAGRDELLTRELSLSGVSWTSGVRHMSAFKASIKLRYNHEAAPGTIFPLAGQRAAVILDEKQFAVTPGQVAAFYDGDELVGGGWIDTPEEDTR